MRLPLLSVSVVLVVCSLVSRAQVSATKELSPASLVSDPYAILNEVVSEQWPATLQLVNAPTNVTMLNPGQCIRAVALASGGGHEHYFDDANLSWSVRVGGQEDSFPLSATRLTKQIKPEGADLVAAALRAGGIHDERDANFTNVTMAASDSKWCVPQGAQDQTIEIQVKVMRGSQETALKSRTIQVESLATAAKRTFKDEKEFGEFIQYYHVAPEPGRLLPAFQYLVSIDQKSLVPFAFFRAAFQHDAATVQGFGPGLAASSKLTEILALNLMAKAGVVLAEPPALTDGEKKSIAEAADLPDAYDMKPDEQLGARQDFLWADFSATGRLRPVIALSSELAWRSDYEAFDAMRKAGKGPKTLTDSIMRGVCYAAAGWSMNSFQMHDPLAADYVDAIAADPATPTMIKDELAHLGTNPAFKQR